MTCRPASGGTIQEVGGEKLQKEPTPASHEMGNIQMCDGAVSTGEAQRHRCRENTCCHSDGVPSRERRFWHRGIYMPHMKAEKKIINKKGGH